MNAIYTSAPAKTNPNDISWSDFFGGIIGG